MHEEKLLANWIIVSRIVKNDRLVNKTTFPQALILYFLLEAYPNYLSTKELIIKSRMMKSQMNRTINSLLANNWINKKVSENDKRCQELILTSAGLETILQTHSQSLLVAKNVAELLGEKDTNKLIEIFDKIIENKDNILE